MVSKKILERVADRIGDLEARMEAWLKADSDMLFKEAQDAVRAHVRSLAESAMVASLGLERDRFTGGFRVSRTSLIGDKIQDFARPMVDAAIKELVSDAATKKRIKELAKDAVRDWIDNNLDDTLSEYVDDVMETDERLQGFLSVEYIKDGIRQALDEQLSDQPAKKRK
jgi:hypothetical protein